MRKIILILGILLAAQAVQSQTLNPFPTTDSLRKFINKWIRNSAVDAFTNLRLNTALIGMSRFVDSADGGRSVDTIYRTPGIDSIFFRISGVTYKIKDSTAGGTTPTLNQVTAEGNGSAQALRITDVTLAIEYASLKHNGGKGQLDLQNGVGGVTEYGMDSIVRAGNALRFPTGPGTFSLREELADTAAAIRADFPAGGGSPGGSTTQVQYNDAGAFAGDAGLTYNATQNKVTTDSVALLKARSTRYAFNGSFAITPFNADTFFISGHSIAHGANAYPTFGFGYLVAEFLGYPIDNQGVPSTGNIVAASKQMLGVNPGHNKLTAIMPSLNEWRTSDVDGAVTGPKTRASHYNTLKSVFWNAQQKNNINPTNGSGVTRNGAWSTNWNSAVGGGKNTNLGAYNNSNGAYIEYAFTDSTVGVRLIRGDQSGTIYINADVKVEIDGVPVDTLFGVAETNGNNLMPGSLDYKLIPVTEVYTGLTNAAHTIRLTTISSGYFLFDGFFNLLDSVDAKYQLWYHEVHMQQSGYSGTQLTFSKTDAMNLRTDSVRLTLHPSYRNRCIIVETNDPVNGYDTVNTNDGTHPDTVGHAQIGDISILSFSQSYDEPTIYFDTATQKYVGTRNSKPYYLAYESDMLNEINDIADNNGNGIVGGSGTSGTVPLWTATKVLGNSAITDNSTTTITLSRNNIVLNGLLHLQGSSNAGAAIYGRGDNQIKWSLYSPSTGGDFRLFNSIGTTIDRFAFTQLGTLKIGTTSVSTDIDSRGFYSNRSMGANKDSFSIITTPGPNYIQTIDTTTGLFKRILPGSLGFMTNPMTTAGDIIVGGSSGTPTRLAAGTANQIPGMNSGATALEYKTVTEGTGIDVTHGAGSLTVAVDMTVINNAVKDSTGYYTITGTTTDATPTNLAVIALPNTSMTTIEATCIAIKNDGTSGFSAVKLGRYMKDNVPALLSGSSDIVADAYSGAGLSTATFTLTNSGTSAAIQVTGEAATTIQWKIRYKILQTSINL